MSAPSPRPPKHVASMVVLAALLLGHAPPDMVYPPGAKR